MIYALLYLYIYSMKWVNILNIIGLIIAIIGLLTGYYIFLFLILPIGFNFFNKDKSHE